MLRALLEEKLSTDFLLILDSENNEGTDLFTTFLHNYAPENEKKICLMCCEYPVKRYLKNNYDERISAFVIFNDPVGWNDLPKTEFDIKFFRAKVPDISNTIFFIDSVSFLIMFYGFYTVIKGLTALKAAAEKVICLGHADAMNPNNLEALKFLSSTFIKILKSDSFDKKSKLVDLHHKKFSGKIMIQREMICIGPDFSISSVEEEKISKNLSDIKEEMKSLTTFELGLEMSDNEKERKKQLILPYLRNEEKNLPTGSIMYNEEIDDDPDDDLDI